MRIKLLVPVFLIALELSCWAQTEIKKFEGDFYQPASIVTPGIDAGEFAGLSPAMRTDLISARGALIGFFQGIEKDGDPRAYLAPSLSNRYKDISELVIKLLGQETTVLSVGMSTSYIEGDGIRLDYYVVMAVEGTTVAVDTSAKLQRVGRSWKIVSFDNIR